MYLTAMRLQRPPEGSWGINIYVHWHPDGLPNREDPWQTVNNPGPDDRNRREVQLKPGGNRVRAYVDMVLEDEKYTHDLVDAALDRMAAIIAEGVSNPVREDCGPDPTTFVGVRFGNPWADREGMIGDYALLHDRLKKYLREKLLVLPSEDERRATLGGRRAVR